MSNDFVQPNGSEMAYLAMEADLRQQLARAEDADAAAHLELAQIKGKNAQQITGLQREIEVLLSEHAELRACHEKLLAERKGAIGIIHRLQRRVKKLVSPWTRIGWFFFPPMRPAWRKAPLQDCDFVPATQRAADPSDLVETAGRPA
jgi:hypothetical protein